VLYFPTQVVDFTIRLISERTPYLVSLDDETDWALSQGIRLDINHMVC
jgi:hypothetical protein